MSFHVISCHFYDVFDLSSLGHELIRAPYRMALEDSGTQWLELLFRGHHLTLSKSFRKNFPRLSKAFKGFQRLSKERKAFKRKQFVSVSFVSFVSFLFFSEVKR